MLAALSKTHNVISVFIHRPFAVIDAVSLGYFLYLLLRSSQADQLLRELSDVFCDQFRRVPFVVHRNEKWNHVRHVAGVVCEKGKLFIKYELCIAEKLYYVNCVKFHFIIRDPLSMTRARSDRTVLFSE